MKRLSTLCFVIAIALALVVIASNQSANARSNKLFNQDSSAQDSTTQDSTILQSTDADPFAETQETQTAATQEIQAAETQTTETRTVATTGSATQGSGSVNSTVQPTPFEKKFWRYLSANNYKNWAPIPGQTGDFTPGQRPHGNLIKMYLNRAAAGNTETLPTGSIIVKENYSADQSLQAITVMYKNAGYNPASGDWYWVKYNPDGSVPMSSADAGATKLAGRVKGCIDCHGGAGGDDFTFFND